MSEREQLEALMARMTPGPWTSADNPTEGTTIVTGEDADTFGIIGLRNAVPRLLAIWKAAEELAQVWEVGDDIEPDHIAALRAALAGKVIL
jgi:hypothetical protein